MSRCRCSARSWQCACTSTPSAVAFWKYQSVPDYAAERRVLDKEVNEVYESRGVQGVFQQFGESGLRKLLNEWHGKRCWFESKHSRADVRVTAIHEMDSSGLFRDMYADVSVSTSTNGGAVLLNDEDVHRLSDVLRNIRDSDAGDFVVAGIWVAKGYIGPGRKHSGVRLSMGIHLEVPSRHSSGYGKVVLDADEVDELARSLHLVLADVELYRAAKKQAEALLEKK